MLSNYTSCKKYITLSFCKIYRKNYFNIFVCISMIIIIFLAGALKSFFIGLIAILISIFLLKQEKIYN